MIGGVTAAIVIGGAWLIYQVFRTESVRIDNQTDQSVFVRAEPVDTCPGKTIAAHEKGDYETSWLCTNAISLVIFDSPLFGKVRCSWSEAQAHQPIVVKADFITCAGALPPTPASVSPPQVP